MSVRPSGLRRLGLVLIGVGLGVVACSGGASTGGSPSTYGVIASPNQTVGTIASPPAAATLIASSGGYSRGGGRYSSPSSSPKAGGTTATTEVTIVNFGFGPSAITVKVGAKVTWRNTGVTHTVTSDTGAFESGPIASGTTYSLVFAKTGTFAYHCSIHPSMVGQVVVRP